MAKNIKKKQSKIKVKKKTWFKVLAPTIFGSKEVGESYLNNAETAVGRIMKVNMRNLTGSMRDQNVYITLQISGVKGNNLITKAVGYELVPIYIKRMIRKRSSRLDEVLQFKTKDGKEIVLKAIVLTLNRNKRSTGSTLRNTLKEILAEEISKSGFESFLSSLVNFKTQITLKKKLNLIYPVKEVMIRDMRLVDLVDKDVVVDESKPADEQVEEPEGEVAEEPKKEVAEEVQEKTKETEIPVEETAPVEEAPKEESQAEATEQETAPEETPAEVQETKNVSGHKNSKAVLSEPTEEASSEETTEPEKEETSEEPETEATPKEE